MFNIFEHFTPAYGRLVRKYALDVWYGRADEKQFLKKAFFFKKRYVQELTAHYRRKRFPVRPAIIQELADEWLKDQIVLTEKINFISDKKKGGLKSEYLNLSEYKRQEVSKLLSGAIRPEGKIAPVVAFSSNLEAISDRLADQSVWDLSTMINHNVVSDIGKVYKWRTQEDANVRKTHNLLRNKLFSYENPPTTIDQYGNKHTGNPGTDWGCRCWEDPAKGKPIINYIARG